MKKNDIKIKKSEKEKKTVSTKPSEWRYPCHVTLKEISDW